MELTMDKKIWRNKWVCNPRFQDIKPLQMLHKQLDAGFQLQPHREDLKNNHTLFRKTLTVTKEAGEVFLDISADDYYKLYINGQFVTLGPANSYPFCYYYNHVDITEFLCTGENVIGAHVYYQGLLNRAYNSGDYRQGMIAEVWQNGQQLIDSRWKYKEAKEYTATRTIAYDTQFDEVIDNRVKLTGWKELSYEDSLWQWASVKEEDDHELVLQPTRNLEVEKKEPVTVTACKDGYILDFGTELTGTFYMKAKGVRGEEVTILYGEELDQGGQVRYDMRCNCLYEDRWILSEGENELEQFEYKCFRYVQLKMGPSIKVWDFKVDDRHYPFEEGFCTFHAEEPLVGQIWEICKNAVKNCAQEAFLDCPHREKGQYLGDLTVTGHAHLYLTGDGALFRKALGDFANSTRICKGMMAVAPGSFMQEIADFSLLFPYQLLIYHEFFQDIEFLSQMLPVAEGIFQYFRQFENASGMLCDVKTKWNLVDWPENLRDGYDFDLSQPVVGDGCHNVINALYIGMEQCMEQIKDILEIPHESRSIKQRKSFLETFYCPETGLFVDSAISCHSSLHANVFACFYGLLPKEHKIVELVRKKGLCCGVFVSYFLLMGLAKMGEGELVYDLITNKSEHSWYNMLQEGATTSYEAWGKEQKWNTSLCHGWAAAPIPVLMKYPDILRFHRHPN